MSRDEPILAWRSWRLRIDPETEAVEPVLESCVYGDPWPEREAFTAYCPEHARPDPRCGCGIYAVTTRVAALEWAGWAQSALPNPIVLGRVQLWGRVLPHSAGYRAETGYPYVPVWTEYRLTGQFMDWLDDVGVKGVEVDLPNQQSIDWEQNFRAIMVVMAALASDSQPGRSAR